MAVSSFTFRFTGNVSYTDDSVSEYSQAYDSRFHAQDVGSDDIFDALFDREFITIDDFLTTLTPTVFTTIDPALDPAGKEVRTFVVHISGQVANDDNSVDAFDFELSPTTSSIDGGGTMTITDHIGTAGGTAFNAVVTDQASALNIALDSISKGNIQV